MGDDIKMPNFPRLIITLNPQTGEVTLNDQTSNPILALGMLAMGSIIVQQKVTPRSPHQVQKVPAIPGLG